MARRASSLTIVLTLSLTYHYVPDYARHTWRLHRLLRLRQSVARQRRLEARPLLRAVNTMTSVLLVVGLCLALILVPSLCRLTLPYQAWPVLMWGLVGALLVMPGIGAALIVQSISRAISIERRARTWDMLLLLPHDRRDVVLHCVADSYSPQIFALSLGIIEFIALMSAALALDQIGLVICALLVVEWIQLAALSITAGIATGTRLHKPLDIIGPALFGGLLIVVRVGLAWIVAALLPPAEVTAINVSVIGPLIALAAPDRLLSVALIAGYFLALEALVRTAFAWTIRHVGED